MEREKEKWERKKVTGNMEKGKGGKGAKTRNREKEKWKMEDDWNFSK